MKASLVAVNEELPSPVTMENFRPNVVVSGMKAFEEDKWAAKIIKIGDVEFRFMKNLWEVFIHDSQSCNRRKGRGRAFGYFAKNKAPCRQRSKTRPISSLWGPCGP
ncbi:hypothetical protein OS493_005663 [Desmophyllum pertusum]|uniref:MOSC domain-containing protein n=1 Tax=Desmophyllum pertusum TaxID=174260 RepID=A0A9X0CMG3_9CNID|nr:hypothetical protein OS493_005663 [Desmophyllum pertusum]